MSKTRAITSLVLGALGLVVWIVLVVVVWRAIPPVGTGVAETAASVRSSVSGVHESLGRVDGALTQTATTIAAFREEHVDDVEAVRERRRRLEAELAPGLAQVREDLEAVREVVRAIDRLLETLDLPFLQTARRAGAERLDEIREKVPRLADGERRLDLDIEPALRLVGEASVHVAEWRAGLDALDADLAAVEERAPRLTRLLCVLVTLLAVWSGLGMVCLIRAGRRALRP